ncbi:MAG TPA: hypothetical protein DD384_06395 [Firmicutes bacterium]|nr:hypothetical protein [Bacillota bacterium]
MKKKALFVLVFSTLGLISCKEGKTTSVSSENNEDTSASTTSAIAEASSENEESSSASELALDLSALKAGFHAKITKAETYDSSSSATERVTDKDAYEVYSSNKALKMVDFYSEDEKKNGFESTSLYVKKVAQYEPYKSVENDEKEYFSQVTVGLDGKVTYKALDIPVFGETSKSKQSWDDAYAKNAFSFLQESDFEKLSDGSFALKITEENKQDDRFANGYYGLNHQIYPSADASDVFEFDNLDIESFTIEVDEKGKPVSFTMVLPLDKNSWDNSQTSFYGTFVYDEKPLEAYQAPELNEPIDAVMNEVRKNNYSFTATKGIAAGDWESGSSEFVAGKTDGTSLEMRTSGSDGKTSNYRQIDETHYQEYSKGAYQGDPISGVLSDKFLPTLPFSSISLEKVGEAEGTTFYVYKAPELVDYSEGKYTSLFMGFNLPGYNLNITSSNTFVTWNGTTLTFRTFSKDREYTATFFDIGKITIDTEVA